MESYFHRRDYEVDPRLVFVARPFRGGFRTVYENHIKQPIESHFDLECLDAADLHAPHSIVEDIWEQICRARFLIADLTGKNPNVFYEVGLGHALGKSVILITQSPDDAPFDIHHLRTVGYSTDEAGLRALETELLRWVGHLLESDPGVSDPAFAEAQRVLGEAVRRCQRIPDALPNPEAFQLINGYSDILLPSLDPARRALLLHTSIKHGVDLIYWAQVNRDNELCVPALVRVLQKGERRPTYRVGLVLEHVSKGLRKSFARAIADLPDDVELGMELLRHAELEDTLEFWRIEVAKRIGDRYVKELLYQARTSRRLEDPPNPAAVRDNRV